MHMGKDYPRLLNGWFDLGLPGGLGPSLFAMIDYIGSASGTLALDWVFPVLSYPSEMCVQDLDTPRVQNYLFLHPTRTDTTMRFKRELKDGPAIGDTVWKYHIDWRLEVTLDDVVMAWTGGPINLVDGYNGDEVPWRSTPWQDIVNPAIWSNWAGTVRSAVWAAVPFYHPYRH